MTKKMMNIKNFKRFITESQKPNDNSLGNPIASTSEAIGKFWQWFGDSKCVDEKGKPLVVYHNTTEKFDTFKKGTNSGLSGNGIYFSEYPLPQFGDIVMKCYLKILNPINKKTEIDGMREINSSGIPTKFIKNIFNEFLDFDGIMNRSEIVVKEPNQIKLIDSF